MEKCPVCRAVVGDQTRCRRCRTDLSVLLQMEDQAAELRQKAMDAFQRQAFSEMFDHAKRSASLISTPESRRLLAGAAVLVKRYETACRFF